MIKALLLNITLFVCLLVVVIPQLQAQVAVNANGDAAHSSAMLDVSSTNKGILIPRLTSAQRLAILTPVTGLLIFDATTNSFWYYNGTATEWQQVGSSVAGAGELDELSDAIYDGSSLFLGGNTGINSNEGTSNLAIGMSSLRENTTGNNNTAIGYYTMENNTDGEENTAVGIYALSSNTTGGLNTAIGYNSLFSNISGLYNAAFGARSLYNNTGNRNTASGYYSLFTNTSGSYNTAIGYRTMYSNTTGSNNTALGYNCGPNGPNYSNTTAIGNEAVITASNQVRIGNSSVTSIGGYVAWTNISDQRFKTNIQEDVSGLDFIMKLRPVTYNLEVEKLNSFLGIEEENTDQQSMSQKSAIRQSGFIAQEVAQAAKKLGYEYSGIDLPKNENDHNGLRYAEFVVPLVKAVQEQQLIINGLKTENDILKALLYEMNIRIESIEK